MKNRFIALLTFGISGLAILAQTNAPLEKWLNITSTGRSTIAMVKNEVTWRDNVRMEAPGMKLTCAWLVADKLPQENLPEYHAVATTNVVIDFIDDKGKTNHTTSDRAVFDYHVQGSVTNETVTLTGNPWLRNDQLTVTGDSLVWDLIAKEYSVNNPKMNIKLPETNSVPGQTNHLLPHF